MKNPNGMTRVTEEVAAWAAEEAERTIEQGRAAVKRTDVIATVVLLDGAVHSDHPTPGAASSERFWLVVDLLHEMPAPEEPDES